MIASSRNRSGCGWGIAGFLLGPLAILVVGFMAPAEATAFDTAVATDVDDPSALERATREAMGHAPIADSVLPRERGATRTRLMLSGHRVGRRTT